MKTNNPNILYHYTTMNSLWNILNDITNRGDEKNPSYYIKLWVTCARYMNDPMEGLFFRKCLYSAFLRYQAVCELEDKSGYMQLSFAALNLSRQTFYAFSLSEHADSLSMWRSYGNNGQGVAIGFDTKELSDAISKYDSCNFLKIEYKTEEDFVNTFTDKDLQRAYDAIEINEDDSGGSIDYLSYEFLHDKYQHIKNSFYSDEREWRLIFNDMLDVQKKFRERNGLIIPFYEIELPIDVIKCLTIGPCADQELSKSSLDSILYHKARGFRVGEDTIRLSEVPYVLR